MSVERLKRVIWRIQEWKKAECFKEKDLRRSIMLECGTSDNTIRENKKRLLELKMIGRIQKGTYNLREDNPQ